MDRSVSTITREFQRNARFKYINNGKCLKPLMVCNKCQKRSYCTYIQAFYNYQEAENKADTRNKSAQNRTLLSLKTIHVIDDINVNIRIIITFSHKVNTTEVHYKKNKKSRLVRATFSNQFY